LKILPSFATQTCLFYLTKFEYLHTFFYFPLSLVFTFESKHGFKLWKWWSW